MTYSTYNSSKHPEIEPFVRDIEGLEPSGKYWIQGLSDDEQRTIRYQLYNWLNTEGLKPQFKIRSFPGELLIQRRGLGSNITTRVESPPLAPKLEELLATSLGVEDSGAYLKSLLSRGEITAEEMGIVLERLGRILE